MDENMKMTFTIVTLQHAPQIDISGSYEIVVKTYLQVLVAFGATCNVNESGEIKCQGERYQSYSQSIKDNLLTLIPINNVFGKLYEIFKNMDLGNPFAFFPQTLSDEDISSVRNEMLKRFLGNKYPDFESYYNDTWKDIHDNYELFFFKNGHNNTTEIGEKEKGKRICRFCGEKQPTTTFENKSHSISEALGNKNIVTNDECDNCNKSFGEGIELDLIYMLDFFRTYYGVHGKGGLKKFSSSNNFEISRDNSSNVTSIKIHDDNLEIDDKNNIKIQLKHPQKINLQNTYRALVKYALSVLDNSYMQYFKETVKWIKCEKSYENLSWITILLTNQICDTFPEISVYIRKNENKDLPYSFMILELDGLKMVAILPLCSKDDHCFNDKEEFDKFWSFLKPCHQIPILKRFKPQDDKSKEFTYCINITQNQ